ncbi:MAG: alpha-hydroxy acid oxidase [Pacificibacter sp.]|uniref:alpha-hydroxy acid oxidase n=1 Tax=Pacificibacter sp. TaxID=1917866 RepID=UPI00321B5F81
MDSLPKVISEYAPRARGLLPPDVATYFLGGAGAQTTQSRNRSDLDAIAIRPRVLKDLRGGHTRLSLLGRQYAHPILAAPMAYQTLLHPEGEAATAAGVAAQDGGMVLSAQAATPLRDVRAVSPACGWFQLYWHVTRDGTLALAKRAADAGFEALILTVDAPVNGVRDGEISENFKLPPHVRAVNLDGLPQPRFAPLDESDSAIFDRLSHVLPTWDDVEWLCQNAPLPVILKGILTPEDARLALESGAQGIIVSNHGGRVLDGAVSAISALPSIVDVVQQTVPVLMDSGVRRGVDVFRALALGADAVLVGQPIACGLAVAGAQGVSHVLRLLRDELEIIMALAGCKTLDEITPDRVVIPAPFSPY